MLEGGTDAHHTQPVYGSLPLGMDRRGAGMQRDRRGMQEFGVCLGCLAVTAWFAVTNWPVVTVPRSVTMRARMTVDGDVMRGMN